MFFVFLVKKSQHRQSVEVQQKYLEPPQTDVMRGFEQNVLISHMLRPHKIETLTFL